MSHEQIVNGTECIRWELLEMPQIISLVEKLMAELARPDCRNCYGRGTVMVRAHSKLPPKILPCGCTRRTELGAKQVEAIWNYASERTREIHEEANARAAAPGATPSPEAVRDGAAVARSSHTRQVAGSNPAPATTTTEEES